MALFPGLCFRLSQTKEMTVNNNESDKEQMKNLNVIECNYTAPLTGGSKIKNKKCNCISVLFIQSLLLITVVGGNPIEREAGYNLVRLSL